ncbi:MAG: hypothetical protein ACK5MK_06515 [Dysgonomonas sp.]
MKSHLPKRGIITIALIIISALTIFVFSSCNKEDVENKDNEINDNYYVKYAISCSYPRIFSDWSVTTPEGNYTRNGYQLRYWEQTYGPVKKGFQCTAQVRRGEPTIEIYVSKNQESFALKTTRTGASASYTIDL